MIRLIKSIPIDYRSPLDRLLEGSKRPLFYTAVLDRASKKASPIWQPPWRDKVQLTQSGLCIYKTDHYCFNERTKKAFRSDAISFARVEYCNYDIRQSQ